MFPAIAKRGPDQNPAAGRSRRTALRSHRQVGAIGNLAALAMHLPSARSAVWAPKAQSNADQSRHGSRLFGELARSFLPGCASAANPIGLNRVRLQVRFLKTNYASSGLLNLPPLHGYCGIFGALNTRHPRVENTVRGNRW